MYDNDPANPGDETPRSWFLFRQLEVIMSLPVEYRWEFTRRHPYYLQFWQLAQGCHGERTLDRQQRVAEDAAALILSSINVAVSMVPPDPHLGPEALGTHDLGAGWVGGAVAPATLRTLATILVLGLPAAQRSQLGRLLNESAEFDSQDVDRMGEICRRLAMSPEAVWDSFPNIPFISINLEQPQRAITEAIEQMVRQWKEERNIPERRRRAANLDAYLIAWDLREGWADGEYNATRERTFQQIAEETGEPISTIVGQYRTAFRYLSGHEYTPELWVRLMGPIKLSRYFNCQADRGLTLRRPWRSPNLRPVTESVLLSGRDEHERPDFLAAARITPSDVAMVDLVLDIETLLERGRSDAEIISELELPAETYTELIAEIRRRHESR
jgi:hypothetical protein